MRIRMALATATTFEPRTPEILRLTHRLIAVAAACAACALAACGSPASAERQPSPDPSARAYDRVLAAESRGELSKFASLLLRAQIFWEPERLRGTAYDPSTEPKRVVGDETTAFFKEVNKSVGQLSDKERAALKKISPDLAVVIAAWEQRQHANGSSD
jgi:hypothetical protein